MRLQVLISTMFQTDHSLLERMNIQSDAIVINQCDRNEFDVFEYNGHCIKWYSFAERGVGLSRNTALMRADADILLFADDDVTYCDGYAEKVIDFFKNNNQVSVAVFNLESQNPARPEYIDKVNHRLHSFNCLKYGAFRIAVKRESLLAANIWFSLLFGGGTKYQAGEDNFFLTSCLKHGLKVFASCTLIGTVEQEESTWFNGYNEKYYIDRGALFKAMYGKCSGFYVLLIELRSLVRKNPYSLLKRIKLQRIGIKKYAAQINGIHGEEVEK